MTNAASSASNPELAAPQEPANSDCEGARAILKGTQRLLRALNVESVSEVTLASGRRADILGIRHNGEIWIVEIKSSIADFRADQKWPEYRDYCDGRFHCRSDFILRASAGSPPRFSGWPCHAPCHDPPVCSGYRLSPRWHKSPANAGFLSLQAEPKSAPRGPIRVQFFFGTLSRGT